MREIPLTRGLVALVDDADYDLVMAYGKWCAKKAPYTFYAVRGAYRADGSRHLLGMHTALTTWPMVDHIDGNGLNNTRDNLRAATKSENSRNSRRRNDNVSGYRGVSWSKTNDKWRALITTHGKRKHLGYFPTAMEAAAAYDAAAKEWHGPYATINLP